VSELAEHTDAQLVAGVLGGDREAFAAIYDRYADRLHDFCHAVLRDRDEAADAVQDTFVLVAQRLVQLNDPDRLRPWLYAVARSVALRKVRERRRVVLDEAEDMADTDPGPERAAEQVALRELVWSAAAGLSERDRALLDLHVRQGLDGAELGDAMGVSPGHAYVLLTRLRDQVERSLGALLIARQGRRDCTELDALLSDWDGRYTPLMRKRVARHVDSCEVCSDRRRIMVSPFALLAAVPLVAAPLWLRDRVLENVELAAYETDELSLDDELLGSDEAGEAEPVAAASAASRFLPRRRTRIAAAAAAVLALLVIGGAVAYWRDAPTSGEPLGLDLPAPSKAQPSLGPATSTTASGPASSTSGSAAATTGDETEGAADPANPGDPATTTRRPPGPPGPPGPPDPSGTPDPPGDTAPPSVLRETADPQVVPVAPCNGTSRVSATITDNVGVTSATLSWSGDGGSGSTEMGHDGDTWFASMGPFTSTGSEAWTITATDAAGNTASGGGGKISVDSCVTRENSPGKL
jgi:RNA polymerase sigma factor (sigma-70 family)